jgi:hypothetical protein
VNKETYKSLYATLLAFKGIGFISFQHRSKSGQVSKILLNVGANYDKARQEDMALLNRGVRFLPSPFYKASDWNQAIAEIRRELSQSTILIKDKSLSPCLKLHPKNDSLKLSHKTNDLYVFGKVERSTVLRQAATRPLTNPVSIAKRIIQDTYLKTSHFKLFLLKDMRGYVKINKQTIEI